MKKCSGCKRYLDLDNFGFYKNSLQSFCKECQKKYAENYNRKNRQNLRETLRKWRSKNKSDRNLSDRQKLEEEFRSKLRRLINGKSTKFHKQFGYSSLEIRKFLLDTFGRLPDKEFVLKYKTPLKDFNLDDKEEWKRAAQFENLTIQNKFVDK